MCILKSFPIGFSSSNPSPIHKSLGLKKRELGCNGGVHGVLGELRNSRQFLKQGVELTPK